MRRVGDDDRRLRYGRDHAPTHPDLADLLHLALDRRVAFRLFEFFLQLPEGHFLPLVPLPVLEQVVGGRQEGEHGDHGTKYLQGEGQ